MGVVIKMKLFQNRFFMLVFLGVFIFLGACSSDESNNKEENKNNEVNAEKMMARWY